MESRSDAGRQALVRELAEGEWPWAAALRADAAFVDGICELAEACARAGISELALAAAVAGERGEQSALARLLLLWYRAESVTVVARVHHESTHVACASLSEAFEVAHARGVTEFVLPRWIAAALGDVVEKSASQSARGGRARIVFEESASGPAGGPTIAEALDASTASLAAATDLVIAVGQPAVAALAQWFTGAQLHADIWGWPVPEAARPLVAPPMAFSASRLNGFVKCPRRWFFEYLCDAVEDEGSAAATYGKVFHEALEGLHRIIRVPADWSGNAILERLHAELDLAFDRNREAFASPLEFEVSRLKARTVAAHYTRWLRAEADDHPMEVESVEALQRWTMGGHEFVGFIDRIDRPVGGGAITIYDYKTGRIDEDPREYVAKIRRGEEAQLALYYTVRRMRGDEVGRMALISLRDPRDAVWVLALDVVDEAGNAVVERTARTGVVRGTCTPADMETAVSELLARADALTQAGTEHFAPGVDPPCSYCAYARACRERPADGERVFAR
jgi:RecB family exonuclease